jgi:hypothetical protein
MYIPDCQTLITSRVYSVKRALLSAFHDDDHLWKKIASAENMNELRHIVHAQCDYSFYIVIDQLNALDLKLEDKSDPEKQCKIDAWEELKELTAGQHYIFSASANENAARDRNSRQRGIETIDFLEGLNEVCPYLFNFLVSCSQNEADAWFKNHQAELPIGVIENRPYIETMTGCIPLLLKSLIGMKDFDRTAFLKNKEMKDVVTKLTRFYRTVFYTNPSNTPRNE